MEEVEEFKPARELIKIYGNSTLSDRVNLFQKKTESHLANQKRNPFSNANNWRGGKTGQHDVLGISKDDPRYGRPPEGSKTEARGKKADSHISKEIQELCTLIKEYGLAQNDGSVIIEFGELFNMYTVISNKLVGLLLRARKHGVLDFPGEMLYQRRDEQVIIKLFPQNEPQNQSPEEE